MDIASRSSLGSLPSPITRRALPTGAADPGEPGAKGSPEDGQILPVDTVTLSPQGLAKAELAQPNGFMTDVKNLGALIQSGDLGAAADAFQDLQRGVQADDETITATAPEFKALGKALSRGDAGTAQKAWQTLQTDLDQRISLQGVASCGCPEPAPTGLKCFTYGILGVDRPKGQRAPEETSYSAGQWVGAALKIAGVVALLA